MALSGMQCQPPAILANDLAREGELEEPVAQAVVDFGEDPLESAIESGRCHLWLAALVRQRHLLSVNSASLKGRSLNCIRQFRLLHRSTVRRPSFCRH
jgi:hypothetical protein